MTKDTVTKRALTFGSVQFSLVCWVGEKHRLNFDNANFSNSYRCKVHIFLIDLGANPPPKANRALVFIEVCSLPPRYVNNAVFRRGFRPQWGRENSKHILLHMSTPSARSRSAALRVTLPTRPSNTSARTTPAVGQGDAWPLTWAWIEWWTRAGRGMKRINRVRDQGANKPLCPLERSGGNTITSGFSSLRVSTSHAAPLPPSCFSAL